MTINGVPLHPLVVHAAVVFVPLAALAAILYVVPRWRWLLRWPTLVLSVGALLAVQAAMMTGEDFEETLEHTRGLQPVVIHDHQEWAERLRIAMFVLTVVTVVAVWAFGHVTRMQGGLDRQPRAAALEKPLMVLLPLMGVVVLVLVVLTGDAGARAVWS